LITADEVDSVISSTVASTGTSASASTILSHGNSTDSSGVSILTMITPL